MNERFGRRVAPMRVAVLGLLIASVPGACALGADSSAVRGATVETSPSTTSADDAPAPTTSAASPTTAAETTTTVATSGTSPVTGGIPGKETSTAMNVSDSYVVGVNGAECDAAWFMMVRGVDMASLSAEESTSDHITAFETSLDAARQLLIDGSPEMQAQAEGAIEFFTSLLSGVTADMPVDQVREMANEWATRDGVNAGTVLFAIQDACPMIVQNAVAPPVIFQS